MKAKYLLIALSVLFLASCAKDSVKEEQKEAITFAPVVGKSTKGQVVTTASLQQFNVVAYTEAGKLYMNETLTKGVETWDPVNGGTHFWPNDGTKLNFYFHAKLLSGQKVDFTTPTAPAVKGYSILAPSQTMQQDFIYAVNLGEEKKASPVQVNFRHALSILEFKAKNINAHLKVTVRNVELCSVNGKADFAFPTKSTTTPSYAQNQNGTNDTELDESWGEWSNHSTVLESILYSTLSTPLTTKDEVYYLGDGKQPMFIIPQPVTAWDVLADKSNTKKGAYFLVDCKLENIAVADDDTQTLSTLYDGKVAVPVGGTFKQGKKYTYTFVFGQGGGYIPPTDTDEPGEPVLVPISFEVTVDEFQQGNGEGSNVSMY